METLSIRLPDDMAERLKNIEEASQPISMPNRIGIHKWCAMRLTCFDGFLYLVLVS